MRSRPAQSTQQVGGQPGLERDLVSKKKKIVCMMSSVPPVPLQLVPLSLDLVHLRNAFLPFVVRCHDIPSLRLSFSVRVDLVMFSFSHLQIISVLLLQKYLFCNGTLCVLGFSLLLLFYVSASEGSESKGLYMYKHIFILSIKVSTEHIIRKCRLTE